MTIGRKRSNFGGRRRFPRGRTNTRTRFRRGANKRGIHISQFIKPAQSAQVQEYTARHTFADFEMDTLLGKNISEAGFIVPSPIQDQAIPLGLAGKDVIGLANTGTGKTVAFLVPVIQRLMKDKQARALILAPTRELAEQIEDEAKKIGRGAGFYGALLIGGTPMGRQFRDLRRRPRMVIGTPGRIKDHMERKSLPMETFNTVVLDEVDRMLDMGFIDDMRKILQEVPRERQSFFFSATLESSVRRLIDEFSQNPETISVKTGNTSDAVEQDVVKYRDIREKIEKLHNVLVGTQKAKFIIFEETKRGTDALARELVSRGFRAESMHGDKTLGERRRALERFKQNKSNILVATDVAARGIDVADITHVINYSTPQNYDDYVHRIGRAGRAGRTGFALTFVQTR